MSKLSQFVTIEQIYANKRDHQDRTADFKEVYDSFSAVSAAQQASRCAQCGVPTCQVGCPLHNNIPDWLKLAAEGRLKEAYYLSAETNSFPEICGRICPQDRLCEGSCVIEKAGHGAVTIGDVERFLTDTAWENGWVAPITPTVELSESVAIIGAGPAGLAAAKALRQYGYQVNIYDRHDRPGGLLIYGIPDFKMDKSIVLRRIEELEKAEVKFHLNCSVGEIIEFKKLYHDHDAVVVATGVYKAHTLGLEGEDATGSVPALDYLITNNRKLLGDQVDDFESGRLNAQNKQVVVIGGGDTAMDCVRTAIRQGAKSVHCLYRRDQKNIPGSATEVKNAIEEGAQFEWLTAPHSLGVDSGVIQSVLGQSMRLSTLNQGGRQAVEPIEGQQKEYQANLLIPALGFAPENLPELFDEKNLELTASNTLKVADHDRMTSIPGVFAAGDIFRGASLVVWAIDDGRKVARSVHQWIQNATKDQLAKSD